MFTIALKIVLVSAMLLAVYYIFLEREKVLKFNRFYLLSSLLFAYTVPFISVRIPNFEKPKPTLIIEDVINQQAVFVKNNADNQWDWSFLILMIYGLVSLYFLIKALISIFKILNLKGESLTYQHQKIKILEKEMAPFSFLGKIYFGKIYWKDNKLDQRIFLHEKLHVQQKHSLDVLLIEILKIITWFNPALYFYKKAVINNHEFLADENVVSNNYEVRSYQHLILAEISHHQSYQLTHQFNFYNTKKRFIMMTKTTSKSAHLKKILILPLFAIFFLAFANRKPAVNQLNNALSESKNIPEFVMSSQVIEDKSLLAIEKDTIKPKAKKIEAAINGKIKSKVSNEKKLQSKEMALPPPPPYPLPKSNVKKEENLIPPPPPISKIESQTLAEFPGGNAVLRQKLSENFDNSKLENTKGMVKGVINIIVSEDGKNYNASYDFDNETFKNEVQKAVEKSLAGIVWKPGTLNGKPVASALKMPITMTFQ